MQPLNLSQLERIGSQLGTNPAGIYQNSEGERFYIKLLESPMHARNEWIAAALYKLAGAPVFEYVACEDRTHIATRWQELDKKSLSQFSEEEKKQARKWFGVHAWTANWDAAGFMGDNQGTVNDTVLTLDVGGALCYRAYGDPKGKAFGTDVGELVTLRTDQYNKHAVKLFSPMSESEIVEAIEIVCCIPDKVILNTILNNGGSQKLADKMIARKYNMKNQSTELY